MMTNKLLFDSCHFLLLLNVQFTLSICFPFLLVIYFIKFVSEECTNLLLHRSFFSVLSLSLLEDISVLDQQYVITLQVYFLSRFVLFQSTRSRASTTLNAILSSRESRIFIRFSNASWAVDFYNCRLIPKNF